jgi:hypothetical protein
MGKVRHSVNTWLQTLDKNFTLDDSGRCFLQRDNETGVVVYVPEEGEEVFLYSDLMRIPDNSPSKFYEQLLTLNAQTSRTGGASITFESSSNQLLAIFAQPLKALDSQTFQNILQNLPRTVESLRSQLKDIWLDCQKNLSTTPLMPSMNQMSRA